MEEKIGDAWRRYVDSRVVDIDRKVTDLQAERRVLLGMRADPPSFLSGNGAAVPESSEKNGPEAPKGPTPTDAVDALVAAEPGAYTRVGIVNQLDGKVASEADNVRATISSAVGRRLKHGRFVLDARKRIWPRDHDRAQAILHQTELDTEG